MSEVLYYALGGGFGHLTRARAVMRTLGFEAPVLCVAEPGRDGLLAQGPPRLPIPAEVAAERATLGAWLEALLHELQPRQLYLDAFPAGLFGEFCGMRLPARTELVHLARLLRWDRYRARLCGPAPRLHRVYRLEPLHADHAAWLRARTDALSDLELVYPVPAAPGWWENGQGGRAHWLVVHAGAETEVNELLDYALETARVEACAAQITLICPSRPAQLPAAVRHLAVYPAAAAFAQADRIVSACGFNVMQETRALRQKHRFLPMPRALDDQFARAAHARGQA